MKLDSRRLGLAGGIFWGACCFLLAFIAKESVRGLAVVHFIEIIYPGYATTFLGSIIGGVSGFVDMFVFLYGISWIYNKLEK